VADGRELRARMDAESFRALLLINGGGAVALLTLPPTVLRDHKGLTTAVLVAAGFLHLGLVFALVHNRMLRKCSLEYEIAEGFSPSGADACTTPLIRRVSRGEPCACCWGIFWSWVSLACFILAGLAVAAGAVLNMRGGAA